MLRFMLRLKPSVVIAGSRACLLLQVAKRGRLSAGGGFYRLGPLMVLGSSIACAAWPTYEANMHEVCLVEFFCLWLFPLLSSDSRAQTTPSMRLAYDSCLGCLAVLLSKYELISA